MKVGRLAKCGRINHNKFYKRQKNKARRRLEKRYPEDAHIIEGKNTGWSD